MSFYDDYKDMSVDLAIDNKELRERIDALEAELWKTRHELSMTKLDRDNAIENLRHEGRTALPDEVDEDEFECSSCRSSISGEDDYCRGCGALIDWQLAREHPEPEWSADMATMHAGEVSA